MMNPKHVLPDQTNSCLFIYLNDVSSYLNDLSSVKPADRSNGVFRKLFDHLKVVVIVTTLICLHSWQEKCKLAIHV